MSLVSITPFTSGFESCSSNSHFCFAANCLVTMAFRITFDEQHETKVHMLQLVLTVLVIAFSIARMTIMNPPPTRANAVGITLVSRARPPLPDALVRNLLTIELRQGIKSLLVLSYQLLTTHKASLRKWKSLKAYAILNCLEVVFWFAVVVVAGMSLSKSFGVAAAMSALAMLLGMVLV